MNKLQALNWLVENVTRWPSKGKGVVSAPINWFWGGFTDGEVKLIKAEPTEMYADCHITQQEWLDVGDEVEYVDPKTMAKITRNEASKISSSELHNELQANLEGSVNIPDRERGGPIPDATPQEAYRKFDEQTVKLLQQRGGPIPKITITHPDAKPDTKWTKMPEVKTKTVNIKIKPQKIYIAGPMTGYTNFNRISFEMAQVTLAMKGYIVLNPSFLPDGLTQAEYMQICLVMVMCADAIYLLKGWDESKGAQAELSLAEKLGLEVIEE